MNNPHICIAFLAAALVASGSCGGGGSSVREIAAAENTEADLGRIREKDGSIQVNLLYANASADTLLPLGAYTRCQCVAASVGRRSVPPGGNLVVSVIYDPAYKKGIFMEEIAVRLLNRSSLSFIIKGDVLPAEHPLEEDHPYDFGGGLHLSHEVLHYGKLKAGETRDIFIRYANGNKKRMDIGFAADSAMAGMMMLRTGIPLSAGGRDTLHFRFRMPDGMQAGDTLTFPVNVYIGRSMLDKKLKVKAIAIE